MAVVLFYAMNNIIEGGRGLKPSISPRSATGTVCMYVVNYSTLTMPVHNIHVFEECKHFVWLHYNKMEMLIGVLCIIVSTFLFHVASLYTYM